LQNVNFEIVTANISPFHAFEDVRAVNGTQNIKKQEVKGFK